MKDHTIEAKGFPTVGDGSGFSREGSFYREELQLASRNRGMLLEALRYARTPTGLHYLLVHYDIPEVDPSRWNLTVDGLVSRPLHLALDDIRRRPSQTTAVTMECAGNGRALFLPRRISQPWLHEAIGTAEWTGIALKALLDDAGIRSEAVEVVFTGVDQGFEGGEMQFYQRSLRIPDAMRDEVLLAYAMNGEPLPPQHGFPLRLVVPGWYGMTSVKWLRRIEVVAAPFEGYQMKRAYRYSRSSEEPGEAVSLIRVRALMIPPGIPDFMTRMRVVPAGDVMLSGRAWAGRLSVTRVEISADGGSTWADARLDDHVSPFAWRGWTFSWHATPGTTTLCVRATDSAGNTQPMQQEWNVGGYGNNTVQQIEAIVR